MSIPDRIRRRVLAIVEEGDKAVVSRTPSGRWRVGRESARRKMARLAKARKPWQKAARSRKRRRLAFEPADLGRHREIRRRDVYEGIGD